MSSVTSSGAAAEGEGGEGGAGGEGGEGGSPTAPPDHHDDGASQPHTRDTIL